MAGIFIFELRHVSKLLDSLRKLREAEPQNEKEITGTICWLKHQMVGKIKQLEPFMRNREWIEDEIVYEKNTQGTDFHDCAEVTCKKPCRGKFCEACWRVIISEIHGEKEHTDMECKKV